MLQIEHNNHKTTDIALSETPKARAHNRETLSESAERAYKLKKFVDEFEKLESQKSAITEAIKATYDAASAQDFKKKPLKQVITDRQKDQQELDVFNNDVSDLKAIIGWAENNPRWEKAI